VDLRACVLPAVMSKIALRNCTTSRSTAPLHQLLANQFRVLLHGRCLRLMQELRLRAAGPLVPRSGCHVARTMLKLGPGCCSVRRVVVHLPLPSRFCQRSLCAWRSAPQPENTFRKLPTQRKSAPATVMASLSLSILHWASGCRTLRSSPRPTPTTG